MGKFIGYILALVGVIGLSAATVPQIGAFFPFLIILGVTPLTIISIVLVIIGVMFSIRGGGRTPKEVPIYHGKNIVGYRRTR